MDETKTRLPPIQLNLTEQGNLTLQGELSDPQLNIVLDSAHLRSKIYLQHQEKLTRESNLTAILIGLLISVIFGAGIFLVFNIKPTKVSFYAQRIIS